MIEPFPPRIPGAHPSGPSSSARALALALGVLVAALVAAAGCGREWPSRAAAGILDRYRKTSGAKPLPAGGMIRIRLSPGDGKPDPTGRSEVLWEPGRYRESVASAGLTTLRGIEWGKGYFTDPDGVTRVASEPILRELLTRSYFWRRAWLFEDREKTEAYRGPEDDQTVSVRLTPPGGNPLLLVFSRRDGTLASVRSPRFRLDFSSPSKFRDASDPAHPVNGEIAWTGLPTGPISVPVVGGGQARFGEPAVRIPLERVSGVVVVPARLSGQLIRLAIDASADGPLRVSPGLASKLPVRFAPDVFGRSVAPGASLEIGAVGYPTLFLQLSDAVPAGADAVAGACLFREAVVEFDLRTGRLGLHDPEKWVVPDGYLRAVTDDDGDRPVAILRYGREELRLAEGSDTGGADLLLAAETAARLQLQGATQATGVLWGVVTLPPLSVRIARDGFFPEWGDDGRLGFSVLARFHVFVDMPHRWTYVRAADMPSRPLPSGSAP